MSPTDVAGLVDVEAERLRRARRALGLLTARHTVPDSVLVQAAARQLRRVEPAGRR